MLSLRINISEASGRRITLSRKNFFIFTLVILAISQLIFGCSNNDDNDVDISSKSKVDQAKYLNDVIFLPLKNDYISFVSEYELALKHSETVEEFDSIISTKLYNKEKNLSDIYFQFTKTRHSKELDKYCDLIEVQIDSISDLYNSEDRRLEVSKKHPNKKVKDLCIKLDDFYNIMVEDGFYDIQNEYSKLVYNRKTYVVNKNQFNKVNIGMPYRDVRQIFNARGILDADVEEKSGDVYFWYDDNENSLDDSKKPLVKIIFASNDDGIDVVKSKEWVGK